MEIPEGFFNARYIFTHTDIIDPMGFGLGGLAQIGMSAPEIADALYERFCLYFAYDETALISGWTFQGVSVVLTTAGEPNLGEHMEPVVGEGPLTGTVANSATLIRKNTSLGGRKHRGRMFWPPFGLSESNVAVGGQLTSAYSNGLQESLDLWHTVLSTSGTETTPWLLHSNERNEDGEEIPGTAASPTLIISFSVATLVGTQRRRIR